MLTCVECGCSSDELAQGWLAYLAQDPEEDLWPEVSIYCPPCGQREYDATPRAYGYF